MKKISMMRIKKKKKTIIILYQNSNNQRQLSKDYCISLSTINKWVKQYSEIKAEDGDVFTAKQIKELQKRNTLLEENQIF